jgi:hypothetical protein
LPWGYAIGRGRLLPIALTSWVAWVLVGGASILVLANVHRAAGTEPAPAEDSTTVLILLLTSWLIDGGLLVFLIGRAAMMRSASGRLNTSILKPMGFLAAMLAISVSMFLIGRTPALTLLALLVTGTPIVLVGGGYGLFIAVMLTFGRNARWN